MPILEDKILNIFIIIEQLFACWNFWWPALLFRTDKKFSNNSIGGEKNKQKCSNGNICIFHGNISFIWKAHWCLWEHSSMKNLHEWRFKIIDKEVKIEKKKYRRSKCVVLLLKINNCLLCWTWAWMIDKMDWESRKSWFHELIRRQVLI